MTKKTNGKTNGHAKVSPADGTPPGTLLRFDAAHVGFRDVNVPLAAATLRALGIEPTEEIDARFYDLKNCDELAGWSAREVEPFRSALVHAAGSRFVTAVMEAPLTVDIEHGHRQLTPFACFHITQRGELPRAPSVPTADLFLRNEEKCRIRMLLDGLDEREALDEGGQLNIERFHEITAQIINCRCVVTQGPNSRTSYLLAVYPEGHLPWTVGVLTWSPLRRAYNDPPTWGSDIEGWRQRTNDERGIY